MKQKIIVSTLGLALIASSAWIPSQRVNAVSFTPPPGESAPKRSTGGASRGSFFVPRSGESAPNRSTGGASRGFIPRANESAPRRSTGGASRGFIPRAGESAPRRSTGGASRGFTPRAGESAPRRSTGGASRGFTPRAGESAPRRTAGGASRGDLFAPRTSQPAPRSTTGGSSREGRRYLNYFGTSAEQPPAILALLPQTYFGTTVTQRPEILVYLPNSGAREAVFSLKDDRGNTLRQMNVPVSGRAGVIPIKVPADLQLEKNYQWFLALKIDGQLTARTPYVDGWIKRVKPSSEVAKAMQQRDLLKQAKVFGKNGNWYDCVAVLAKLRATQPSNANLSKEWSELLKSVGLQQIEKAPVLALNTVYR